MVVNANVYDSLYAAATTDYLQVDLTQSGGSAVTSSGGRPEVNTTHAAGIAWGSGAITAGAIASNAVTSAKIATDAITADKIAANAITSSEIADGALTAAKFAASSLDGKGDWNTTTPPTVAAIRSEMDSNSTQLAAILADAGTDIPATLATIAGYLDTEIAAILEDTGTTIPGLISGLNDPTAAAIANAVIGATVESNGTITLQQAVSVILAAVAGVTADAGATLKDPSGTATRIAATINGSNERTAMTITPSS